MRPELFYPPRIFGAIPSHYANFESSRVVVLPVPYDSTTSYRSGARDGPQAIIDASQNLELYDPELDREVYRVGIHTLPEMEPLMSSPQDTIQRLYQVVKDLAERDKMVALLGGEHSLTLGAVTAFKERFPNLSVLALDAHADLRDEYLGTRYSHACVLRRVWELCPLLLVGLRSLSLEERRFVTEQALDKFSPGELEQARARISALSPFVYITIDLDVLDPAIMSAVGTPEPGGLGWREVLGLLQAAAQGRRIVGFDLTEFSPREGPISCAFLASKLAYKLMGYATS